MRADGARRRRRAPRMYLAHAAQWHHLAAQAELLKVQAEKRFVVANGAPELVAAMNREDISVATAVELARLPGTIRSNACLMKNCVISSFASCTATKTSLRRIAGITEAAPRQCRAMTVRSLELDGEDLERERTVSRKPISAGTRLI